jgi:hypothetical protein
MPRSDRFSSSSPSLQPWHWFVLSAAAPLIHCASRLDLDLWHDEIYTVDHFVSRGPAAIVTDYSLPNNHVLYSLVLWPFYLVSDLDFVLRLPSFFFTLGTLACVFSLGFRYAGVIGAVLGTSLLGLNQMFLIHTIQVRGYGLSMFLTAWLAWLALAEGSSRRRRLVAVAFVGAALLYVMPTNVLFFAPLAAASLGLRVARRAPIGQIAREAAAWAVAGTAALVCYLPIATQVRAAAESASPSSWTYLPVIAWNFLRPASHDAVWLWPLLGLSVVALLWPRADGAPRRWALPIAALAAVAGAFLLTGLMRVSPFERNYCPLLVWLALAAGWLLAEFAYAVCTRLRGSPEKLAAFSLALVSMVFWPQLWSYPQRLTARREQAEPPDQWVADGYYCYYAANYRPSAVVRYLADQDARGVSFCLCYANADFVNLSWYILHCDLGNRSPPAGEVCFFAVAPAPPPWTTIAHDCQLSQEVVSLFGLIGDFGFYRLYQTAAPIDVGPAMNFDPASQRPATTAK